jgi:hypothetical protein
MSGVAALFFSCFGFTSGAGCETGSSTTGTGAQKISLYLKTPGEPLNLIFLISLPPRKEAHLERTVLPRD